MFALSLIHSSFLSSPFLLLLCFLVPPLPSSFKLFYVALEQQHFLGLPLFFPVSGLLPWLQIDKCKQWAREHQQNKNELIQLSPYFIPLKLLNRLIFYRNCMIGTEGETLLFCSETQRCWVFLPRNPHHVLVMNPGGAGC